MLVETEWLAAHVDDQAVVVVDMRWREDGSAQRLYREGHVRATFIDWSSDLVDPQPQVRVHAGPGRPVRLAHGAPRHRRRFGRRGLRRRDGIGTVPAVARVAPLRARERSRAERGLREVGRGGSPAFDAASPPPSQLDGSREPASPWLRQSTRWSGAPTIPTSSCSIRVRPSSFAARRSGSTGPISADPEGIAHTPRGDLRAGPDPWARNVPVSTLYRADGTMRSPESSLPLRRTGGRAADQSRDLLRGRHLRFWPRVRSYAGRLRRCRRVRGVVGGMGPLDPQRPVARG